MMSEKFQNIICMPCLIIPMLLFNLFKMGKNIALHGVFLVHIKKKVLVERIMYRNHCLFIIF